MGFFDSVQRWQRRRRAQALLLAGDVEGAKGVIGADAALRHELAEGLLDAGRLELSQALLGHQGESTFDALLAATPADPELERLLAEAGARTLPGEARVLELSRTLLERGEQAAALSLLERAALSSPRWPLLHAALEACTQAQDWKRAWPLVEAGLGALKPLKGTPEHEALLRAHQLVLGHLEGAEAVTVDLLMRGEVDPFSGRHHLPLARALMREGPTLATRLTLVSAPQELREGEAMVRAERKDAGGLLQVGSAKLRLGDLPEAIDAFERGRAVAPRHFALVAGLGAARTLEREHALPRLRSLPDVGPLEGLASLLPDLEQLTPLELRVVQASVKPLARWLPAIQRAGGRLRVLPLDVRVIDLPDFEALRSPLEHREHRGWDALGGLAGDALGCVRVEDLLDTSELGWALAHEFAHLVHQVLPEPVLQAIDQAWLVSDRLINEREFFAATYTRWLSHQYGLAATPEPDAARTFGCIELARS